jgi:Predicted 3'-5' exonuclease related to the exonuclease domain of PolB
VRRGLTLRQAAGQLRNARCLTRRVSTADACRARKSRKRRCSVLFGQHDGDDALSDLSLRPYFNRYTEDAIDLCDVLSSFSPHAKATLNELCRVMGLPGKPNGMSGGNVEKYYREGQLREIAEYCEIDVVNTYRVWLRRGRLSTGAFQASELNLVEFIKARGNTKPHLAQLTDCTGGLTPRRSVRRHASRP